MTTELIISDSRLAPFLMGLIWFNCNKVFNRFEFIFSNPRRLRGRFGYCYSCPDYILNFFYYILYFNINNNNN